MIAVPLRVPFNTGNTKHGARIRDNPFRLR